MTARRPEEEDETRPVYSPPELDWSLIIWWSVMAAIVVGSVTLAILVKYG